MENQQTIQVERTGAQKNFKLMNKLGTLFFIMFLIGITIPVIDLGEWSDEVINVYNLVQPISLVALAVIGLFIFVSGVSRTAGRVTSLLFILTILISIITQLLDVYDMGKSMADMTGREFEFRHFKRALENTIPTVPSEFRGRQFPAGAISVIALLVISFFGILGCVFAPRYKENKQLKAAITGQVIEADETSAAIQETSAVAGDSTPLFAKVKDVFTVVVQKLIAAFKYAYQIIQPLVDVMLDKIADIVCEKQPQLKREQVKVVFFIIFLILIFLLIS